MQSTLILKLILHFFLLTKDNFPEINNGVFLLNNRFFTETLQWDVYFTRFSQNWKYVVCIIINIPISWLIWEVNVIFMGTYIPADIRPDGT